MEEKVAGETIRSLVSAGLPLGRALPGAALSPSLSSVSMALFSHRLSGMPDENKSPPEDPLRKELADEYRLLQAAWNLSIAQVNTIKPWAVTGVVTAAVGLFAIDSGRAPWWLLSILLPVVALVAWFEVLHYSAQRGFQPRIAEIEAYFRGEAIRQSHPYQMDACHTLHCLKGRALWLARWQAFRSSSVWPLYAVLGLLLLGLALAKR